jgi:hypothetical protein
MEWVAAAIVLALFLIFPKRMLTLAGIFIAIIGVIAGYFFYEDWKNDKDEGAVTISITHSLEKCKEPYPLVISILNESSRVVSKVEWDIVVKKPGFSSDLTEEFSYREYSQDRILKPGEGWGICARVPKLNREIKDYSVLDYSIENKYVLFQE